MITFTSIQDNFNFLVTDVVNQSVNISTYLSNFDPQLLEKIVSRDDYIDNLKTSIENDCFSVQHMERGINQTAINQIRAIHVMTTNLERIADFIVNIALQVEFLFDRSLWLTFDFSKMSHIITDSLNLVEQAVYKKDLGEALRICKAEFDIDRHYKKHFDRIMFELRKGENIKTYITILFIFRYLERIGDSLLNVGEAILFAIVGEKIKIRQFEALQQTLAKSSMSLDLDEMDFQSFWGTRSGCNISKVSTGNRSTNEEHESIFKTGNCSKIKKEKQNMEKWATIIPGLAPRVFSYYEDDDSASLLSEFITGQTLDEIILSAEQNVLDSALLNLQNTLGHIWETTQKAGASEANFMGQLMTRIDAITSVHPEYIRSQQQMGKLVISSTYDLVRQCHEVERLLPAPFSVFIHGDCNVNNILFDQESERIHFIDLYRSRHTDLIQDISVILISNFRLPVFEPAIRQRINRVIEVILTFSRYFCKEHGDSTFDLRLALALARSFFTSTRFELNTIFAKEMSMRGNFLLEKVARYQRKNSPWQQFKLPEAVLYYK